MRKKAQVVYILLCSWLLLGTSSLSYAGSSEVLPKGIFRVSVKYGYYFTVDKKFDEDGHKEDVSADYNTTLDSSVFSQLGDLEAAFGEYASIGDSVVDFDYKFQDFITNVQYGLTDRLSVGIEIPYYWNKTKVKEARVDTTNATFGFNPDFGTPGDPFGVPLIPVSLGGVKDDAMATELAQSELEALGYKRIKNWSDSGLSDIEAGFRYQYFKTEDWRLAFTAGVRAPTGDKDDPDNLVDTEFGTGAWAFLFRLNNDYTGVDNLILDFTFKYDLVLPDKQTLRVPDDPDMPITANKEQVDIDLGDVFRFEVEGAYELLESFSPFLIYEYAYKLKDKVSGDEGFRYKSLEEQTDWTYQRFEGGLSYSTIPAFRTKKFPLPLVLTVSYETYFAGSNDFLEQKIIWFNLVSFF